MKDASVLVHGLDPTASAVARLLLLSGFAVALHQSDPPTSLSRKMDFSDTWHEGVRRLDGVEARRVNNSADFLSGLRSRMFIPLLTQPMADVVARWPWDATIDVRSQDERRREKISRDAGLTIALGAPAVAGVDCDLIIDAYGPDPGAVIRSGPASPGRRGQGADRMARAAATKAGVFTTTLIIGEIVESGAPLGDVGGMMVRAPASGRIRGLQRSGRAVFPREVVAEIARDTLASVSGCDRANQAIARAVVFAVEMELSGVTPLSFDDLF